MDNLENRHPYKSTLGSSPSKDQNIQDSMSHPNTSPGESNKAPNGGRLSKPDFQRRGSADIILEAAKLAETMGGSSPGKFESRRNLTNQGNQTYNPISNSAIPSSDQAQNRAQQIVQGRQDDISQEFQQPLLTPPTALALHSHSPTLPMDPSFTSASSVQVTSSATATFHPFPPQVIAYPKVQIPTQTVATRDRKSVV